jgi:predicted Rossmann fold flavoprotein
MFPTTDSSQTIINCLVKAAENAGVEVLCGQNATAFYPPGTAHPHWKVKTQSGDEFLARHLLLAAGSSPRIWQLLESMGHRIVPPVPSLFTFNIQDKRIDGLAGLAVKLATVQVAGSKLQSQGPLLITHWGMSGPAILKLSAWGARDLHERDYRFEISINCLGNASEQDVFEKLQVVKQAFSKKTVKSNCPYPAIPKRLWESFLEHLALDETARWADLSKKTLQALAQQLVCGTFQVSGKSTFKEEFVTAGGVHLDEVDFKTFQSKLQPRLFFAGELLDIDAITGGFNFQAAWTGGYLAGMGMANDEH